MNKITTGKAMVKALIAFVAVILGTIGALAVRAEGANTEVVDAHETTAELLSGDDVRPIELLAIQLPVPNAAAQEDCGSDETCAQGEDPSGSVVGNALSGITAGEIQEIVDDGIDEAPVVNDDETLTPVGINVPSTSSGPAIFEPSESTAPSPIANPRGEDGATGNVSVAAPPDTQVQDEPDITTVAEDATGTLGNPDTAGAQAAPTEPVILAAPSDVVCTTTVLEYSATGEPTSGTYTWTWTDNSEGEVTHRLAKHAAGRTVTIDVNTSFEYSSTFRHPQPQIIAIYALAPDGEAGPSVQGPTCTEPENQTVGQTVESLAAPTVTCTNINIEYDVAGDLIAWDDEYRFEPQDEVTVDHWLVQATGPGGGSVITLDTNAVVDGPHDFPSRVWYVTADNRESLRAELTGCTPPPERDPNVGGATLVAPSNLQCRTGVTEWESYVSGEFLYSRPVFWEHQWTWTDNSVGEDHHEIVTTYEFQAVTETEIAGTSAVTHGGIRSPNGQQFIFEIRAVSGDDRSDPLIGGKCSDFGTGVPDDILIGPNPN